MAVLENSRKERFVQNLLCGMSQRKAYRDAFPSSQDWSDKTVDNRACELANNKEVRNRLDEIQNARADVLIEERRAKMNLLGEIASDSTLPDDERFVALEALVKMDSHYEGSLHDITPKDVALNCICVMLDPDVKPVQKRAAYLLLTSTYSRDIVNDALVPYATVLDRRDPLVYKWKTIVTKRDKVCQICGSTEHLEVHHKSPWAEDPINRVNPANGVLLCSDCHAKQHPDLSPGLFRHVRASG